MLISPSKIVHDSRLPGSWDRIDQVDVIIRAMSIGEGPIIAVHPARAVRIKLLERLVPALHQENVRVIQATSLDGEKIELISLMDQVVGEACSDAAERSERCYTLLTSPTGAESRIALVVGDAHLATHQTLKYLDLVALLGKSDRVPLHIMLVGSPEVWDRLPPTGGLSPGRGALRVVLSPDLGEAQSEADMDGRFIEIGAEPAGESIVSDAATAAAWINQVPAVAGPAAHRDDASFQEGSRDEPDAATVIEPGAAIDEASAPGGGLALDGARGSADSSAAEAGPEAEPPLAGGEMRSDSPQYHRVRSSQARRGRLTVAACVGAATCVAAIIVGTGFVLDRYIDEPAASTVIPRSADIDQIKAPVGESGAIGSTVPAAPVPGFVARLQPAAAEAFPVVPVSNTRDANAAGGQYVAGRPAIAWVPAPESEAPPAAPAAADQSAETASPSATAEPPGESRSDAPVAVAEQEPASPPGTAAETTPTAASATYVTAAAPAAIEPTPGEPSPPLPAEAPAAPALASGPAAAFPGMTVASAAQAAPPPGSARDASTGGPTNNAGRTDPEASAARASVVTVSEPRSPPEPASPADSTPPISPTVTAVAPTSGSGTVAAASPPAAVSPGAVAVPPAVVAVLIGRGDGLLAIGDVTAARLMYRRAAGYDSAQGAIALGMTYDPRFLAQIGAQGIPAEPQRAMDWYRRAAVLGRPEGTRLLAQLQAAHAK